MNTDAKRETEMEGEIYLFLRLANEMRLDCQRIGWYSEAQSIKMMQDNLKTLGRIRYESQKPKLKGVSV